jgi:hypothetical protein
VYVPTSFAADGFCGGPAGEWAWCEDFDGRGMSGPAPFEPHAFEHLAFSTHTDWTSHGVNCPTFSSCEPFMENGSLFLRPEDGGFGMAVMRIAKPFDFEATPERPEGRIHFTSDMKGQPRMFSAIYLSPMPTESLPDLRNMYATNNARGIALKIFNEGGMPFQTAIFHSGGASAVTETATFLPPGLANPEGTRSQTHDTDVYITRHSIRVEIDGAEVYRANFADAPLSISDLGFDRAYVYFAQLSYNTPKIGADEGHPELATEQANTFLWDNLAFDGPSLAPNSLTPAGKKWVIVRAWSSNACTIKGKYSAELLPYQVDRAYLPEPLDIKWDPRHFLVPEEETVELSDITCTRRSDYPVIDLASNNNTSPLTNLQFIEGAR